MDQKLDYFSRFPDLIASGKGPRTILGLRKNLRFCLKYLSAWLQGVGSICIDNKLEDLSSLEISRAQLWQWKRHNILLDDGEYVTTDLIEKFLEIEYENARIELQSTIFQSDNFDIQENHLINAKNLTVNLVCSDIMIDYFTNFVYE